MVTSPQSAQKFLSFSDLGANSGALELQAGPIAASLKVSYGTFTANGATTVSVVDTRVTAHSIILITVMTPAGTPSPTSPNVIGKTAGVGFDVDGTASDTSVYEYVIFG
jgi:hypothetical protein